MPITRRALGKAAVPAAIWRFLPGAAQLKAADKNSELGFGFIGIGIRGMFLLEQFHKLPGARALVAADVYDSHFARAKEIAGDSIETTRDYRRVIDNKDVDVVVIATPDHWHSRMALDALSAGKHVYLEKPMAWSIEQQIEIAHAVKRSGRKLQTGSGAGNQASAKQARDLIKQGLLGKLNRVVIETNRNSAEGAWVYEIPPDASPKTIDWDRFLGPAPKRAYDPKVFFRWRCWWEYSGGVATDLFVHMLTGLHEMVDVPAPKSVVAQGGIYRWKDGRTVPDLLNAVYEYPNEFVADITVNLGNSRGGRSYRLMGTEGTLEVGQRELTFFAEPEPSNVQTYAVESWPKAMREAYFASHPRPQRRRPAEPKQYTLDRGQSHQELFLDALRNDKPVTEDEWKGHAAAGAAHLANVAYKEGRRVSWDWKTGKIS